MSNLSKSLLEGKNGINDSLLYCYYTSIGQLFDILKRLLPYSLPTIENDGEDSLKVSIDFDRGLVLNYKLTIEDRQNGHYIKKIESI